MTGIANALSRVFTGHINGDSGRQRSVAQELGRYKYLSASLHKREALRLKEQAKARREKASFSLTT